MVATSDRHSPSVRPPAISSSSSSFGSVASARASSSRLRCSSDRLPAGALACRSARSRPGFRRSDPTTSASRRRDPKAPATSRFSNTVSFSKGCGIWKVRPMPDRAARHRRHARHVAAVESGCVPLSAAILPVIRLNSVDLPAPFGPMMPSASPSPTAKRNLLGDRQGAEFLRDPSSSRIAKPIPPRTGGASTGPAPKIRRSLPSCRRSECSAPSCCR